MHLSTSHSYEARTKKNDARLVCGINGCTKHHHRTLHSSKTPYIAGKNALNAENEDTVLLSMQEISTPSGKINCFFDDGSNRCLILESAVKRLGLIGEDIIMKLHTVIGDKESYTKVFSINLLDVNNQTHTIQAFAVPKIGNIQVVSSDGVKGLFSQQIQKEWDKVEARPSGEVELLVGSNYIGLHPYRIEANNNIQVLKSMFGSGYVLVGCHSALKSQEPQKYLTHKSKYSGKQLDFQICQGLLGLK